MYYDYNVIIASTLSWIRCTCCMLMSVATDNETLKFSQLQWLSHYTSSHACYYMEFDLRLCTASMMLALKLTAMKSFLLGMGCAFWMQWQNLDSYIQFLLRGLQVHTLSIGILTDDCRDIELVCEVR